jgi:hypothetical protein
MNLRARWAIGLLIGAPIAAFGCGSSSGGGTPGGSSGGGASSGSGETSSGSGTSSGGGGGSGFQSGSGVTGSGASESGGSSSGTVTSSGAGTGDDSGSAPGDDGSVATDTDSGSPPPSGDSGAPPACVKGATKAAEVVVIGDSYLNVGHIGPDLTMDAMAMWRRYDFAGAAMNYGSGDLNIPYQYLTEAIGASPDIKVVVMDGGGNDILVDNHSCLSSATISSTCMTAVDNANAKGKSLMQSMVKNGVEHIVYFYYPHLDPTGGGLLTTPAPGVNVLLDYARPQVEMTCCGAAFTSTATNYSCRGNTVGTDCVFVDLNPIFAGHQSEASASTYWFQSDNVHPNDMGGSAAAAAIWKTMQDDCVAQ